MNIQQPSASSQQGAGGFTLLELLIVISMIAILAGAVALSMGSGGRDRQLRAEADRLARVLELVGEEAALRGESLGLRPLDHGYEFLRGGAAGWERLEGDNLLAPVRLDDGTELRFLDYTGEEFSPGGNPAVVFAPHGVMTPVDIEFKHPAVSGGFRLYSDAAGRVLVEVLK